MQVRCRALRDFIGTKAEGAQAGDPGAFVPQGADIDISQERYDTLRELGFVDRTSPPSIQRQEKAPVKTKEEKSPLPETKDDLGEAIQ